MVLMGTNYLCFILFVLCSIFTGVMCDKCNFDHCSKDLNMTCGFDEKLGSYSMFASYCTYEVYNVCHGLDLKQVPIHFCIKYIKNENRRMYGESCPLFCPSHYSPVCGMSKLRTYLYKSFTNGCYLDILNCRGDEDYGYVEVPLSYCQRHSMKNIYKQNVVLTGVNDYKEYNEY